MVKKMQYQSLDHALKYLKIQVLDSLPFAQKFVPNFKNPEDLFYWLKTKVVYINDPSGIELFQTMPRMFGKNNFHGIKGAGDCDCFTITTLASCIKNNWLDLGIRLTGRQPNSAVHIYTYVYFNGEQYFLDLTNNTFDKQRYYPFFQDIPFKL